MPRCEVPLGSFTGGVGPSTSRTTSLATPWMVRSPVTFNLPAPADSTRFDLKVMVGYLATSKKWSLRRSSSRLCTRLSTEPASIVIFTEALLRPGESTSTGQIFPISELVVGDLAGRDAEIGEHF